MITWTAKRESYTQAWYTRSILMANRLQMFSGSFIVTPQMDERMPKTDPMYFRPCILDWVRLTLINRPIAEN